MAERKKERERERERMTEENGESFSALCDRRLFEKIIQRFKHGEKVWDHCINYYSDVRFISSLSHVCLDIQWAEIAVW